MKNLFLYLTLLASVSFQLFAFSNTVTVSNNKIIVEKNFRPDTVIANLFQAYQADQLTSILPNFSYAGYKSGERAIPNVSVNAPIAPAGFTVINVTNPAYGAIPNDNLSDKVAIQNAINAASLVAPAIVFFPPGDYLINEPTDNISTPIVISSSNIILKGSGTGSSGTRLIMNSFGLPLTTSLTADTTLKYRTLPMIQCRNTTFISTIGTVIGTAPKGSHEILVSNVGNLRPGGYVQLQMSNSNSAYINNILSPYKPDADWTEIINNGIQVRAFFKIVSIKGNKLTLKEPIDYPITSDCVWNIRQFRPISDIGVEDIEFVGKYLASFVHHRYWQDDSGWNIFEFKGVADSWMRRCVFTNVTNAASAKESVNITFLQDTIKGNRGHIAIHSEISTNILIKECVDVTGQHHTFGVAAGAYNTVVTRCSWPTTTCFESHASQPRNTLIDAVRGGFVNNRAGGADGNLPNHMENLILWNYRQTNTALSNFQFWSTTGSGMTVLKPIVVGFNNASGNTTFNTSQLKSFESIGTPVSPASLYEAQLAERLANIPNNNSSTIIGNRIAVVRVSGPDSVGISANGPFSGGNKVHLDIFSENGDLLKTVTMPPNFVLGNSIEEGRITRSLDSQYLVLSGYNNTVSTGLANTTANTVNRKIATFKIDGTINLLTPPTPTPTATATGGVTTNNNSIISFSSVTGTIGVGNFVFGTGIAPNTTVISVSGTTATLSTNAVTTSSNISFYFMQNNTPLFANGTHTRAVVMNSNTGGFYLSSGETAIQYFDTATNTLSNITAGNTNAQSRALNIFDDQLFFSNSSGHRLGTLGIGMPITSTVTSPLNYAVGSAAPASPSDFIMFDLDTNVPGVDVMYVLETSVINSTAQAIVKYSKVNGEWKNNGGYGIVTDLYNSLTGIKTINGIELYAVRKVISTSGGAPNELVRIIDNTGYNTTMSSSEFLMATAPSGSWRGVIVVPTQFVQQVPTFRDDTNDNDTSLVVLNNSNIQFWGEAQENINVLNWQNRLELNSKGYELYYSKDGLNFENIHSINSKKTEPNNIEPSNYSFKHNATGTVNSYYRLKHISTDGTIQYAKTLLLNRKNNSKFLIEKIYPNPVTNYLNLTVTTNIAADVFIQIYSATGSLVLQKKYYLQKGMHAIGLDVAALANGTYNIRLIQQKDKGTIPLIFFKGNY